LRRGKENNSGPDVVDHACHFSYLVRMIMVRVQASQKVSMLSISTNNLGIVLNVYNLDYVGDIDKRFMV
jgi:hypothetical protein